MTALTRIHGGKIPLTSLDDRSRSGTPLTATAAITAGTSRPATITDTGFVHDSYGKERKGSKAVVGSGISTLSRIANRNKLKTTGEEHGQLTLGSPSRAMAAPSRKSSAE